LCMLGKYFTTELHLLPLLAIFNSPIGHFSYKYRSLLSLPSPWQPTVYQLALRDFHKIKYCRVRKIQNMSVILFYFSLKSLKSPYLYASYIDTVNIGHRGW
jgi:hypothetical protein